MTLQASSKAAIQPLVDVHGLALQLGVSASSIYRRRSLGEPLPRAIRLGSRLRWTQESIDEYIRLHAEPES